MKKILPLFACTIVALISTAQNRHDIIIDELMIDPSPVVGLPAHEWIELKNRSATTINLLNFRIGNATTLSGAMPSYQLQPDSFVVICSNTALPLLSSFAPAVSVTNFPSLDNSSGLVYLRSATSNIIHAVSYSDAWHANEIKKEGGWTLEMVDTRYPCAGNNWTSSSHEKGGTPGKLNSQDGVNKDETAPSVIKAFTISNTAIIIVFDEPLDSLFACNMSHYELNNNATISSVVCLPPLFNQAQLNLRDTLIRGTIYSIAIKQAADCANNKLASPLTINTGLPVDPLPGEWVINEILFNPLPGGYDFIEFFNNSNKIFDAARLFIANRNSTGQITNSRSLSPVPHYIFPGDHIVITENKTWLINEYHVLHPANIFNVSTMPSFPDDAGEVVTLNFQGMVTDEVHYKDNWHFKLINNDEGVSLERLDPSAPSQQPASWHSASSSSGYATPTYKNSQFTGFITGNNTFTISPQVFSPDNDGRDDIALIQYQLDEPGYVTNIIVYHISGKPVRQLVRNAIMGRAGFWTWDGLDDQGMRMPVGCYIILVEIFNLRGKRELYRHIIVLGRPLQ